MHLVFSYGSLRGKFANQKYAELVGYYKIDRSEMFPRLVESNQENTIEGVVLSLDDYEFEQVDLYEGYPDLYTRKEVEVYTENGKKMAWLYF